MTQMFLVETRTVKLAGRSPYLSCDYVFFADSIERAEEWMSQQNPDECERYYYCIVKVPINQDKGFKLIGYYNMSGEKSTQDRCMAFALQK